MRYFLLFVKSFKFLIVVVFFVFVSERKPFERSSLCYIDISISKHLIYYLECNIIEKMGVQQFHGSSHRVDRLL